MLCSSEQPCNDHEPNRIAEDRDYRHFTGDGQFTENEDLRVRPLSFHQSTIASTHDPAESNAHCTYRSEKQVQNDLKFITLNEKT